MLATIWWVIIINNCWYFSDIPSIESWNHKFFFHIVSSAESPSKKLETPPKPKKVGISQIAKVEDNFSIKWKDNFLIASLNGNHIYRVKFDQNYEKILFKENIFIGERMRDLVYFKEKNVFLLALENSGSLGVLKP